ncbi:MAG: hypothetical protein KAU49_08475 [Candidatus Krumholzibacteria bacterium]|nr:hypothetical protein [Candidatus Krumholzibacteria bacterium]
MIVFAAALTLVLAGDALAGDKGGKKDKKDKKDKKSKKEKVVRKDNERTEAIIDPTRPNKSTKRLRSSGKGKGGNRNSTKSQTRTRSRQKSQKRSCKRSSGGKK